MKNFSLATGFILMEILMALTLVAITVSAVLSIQFVSARHNQQAYVLTLQTNETISQQEVLIAH